MSAESFTKLLVATLRANAAVYPFDGTHDEARDTPPDAACRAWWGVEACGGNVRNVTALLAKCMMVRLHVRIEPRHFAKAERAAEPRLRQCIERVVHSGKTHLRERRPQAIEQLLRCGVIVSGSKGPHDSRALLGHLEPSELQVAEHALSAFDLDSFARSLHGEICKPE